MAVLHYGAYWNHPDYEALMAINLDPDFLTHKFSNNTVCLRRTEHVIYSLLYTQFNTAGLTRSLSPPDMLLPRRRNGPGGRSGRIVKRGAWRSLWRQRVLHFAP